MTALVEEAVSVGDLVRIFTFQQGDANMVELTLPDDSPVRRQARSATSRGRPTRRSSRILREGHVHRPDPDATLEAHDELLFVATAPRRPTSRRCSPQPSTTAPSSGPLLRLSLDCGRLRTSAEPGSRSACCRG